MSQSFVQYEADGLTGEFDVPFPYLRKEHVQVRINGAPPALPLRWVSDSRVKIADNIAAGSLVELRRQTPISQRLVDFQNGSVLTEEELDTAILQVFYIQQELKDLYEASLSGSLATIASNGGVVVPSGADVLDQLALNLISSEAAQNLSQALADISLTANQLTALALDTSRIDSDLSVTTSRVDTLRADHDGLVVVVDGLLGGDPGAGVATAIQQERDERIAGDAALASTFDLIGAKSGDNLSFIVNTNTVKVSPTESLGERLTALSATDATNTAAIQTEETARIAGDNALASSVSLLDTRVGDAEASILTEQTARIAGDTALANTVSLLGAVNAQGTAFVLNTATTEVAPGETLANRLSALSTADANASAAILSEQNARIAGDTALAADISTLTTTVNNNTATVTSFATSINGLQARYGVALDVNGYITGFVQNNDGQTGSFTVRADTFSIVASNGTGLITPFSVTAEGVRINGNLVVNGSIQTAQLAANSVTNGNASFTAAAIPIGSTWTAVQSCTLTTSGGRVRVDFAGAFIHTNSNGGDLEFRIKRGSTVIHSGILAVLPIGDTITIQDSETFQVIGTATIPAIISGGQSIFFVDNAAPSGNLTYTIELQGAGTIQSRQMALLELKR